MTIPEKRIENMRIKDHNHQSHKAQKALLCFLRQKEERTTGFHKNNPYR